MHIPFTVVLIFLFSDCIVVPYIAKRDPPPSPTETQNLIVNSLGKEMQARGHLGKYVAYVKLEDVSIKQEAILSLISR